ncbi:MAG: UDP-2,4-diacetamido-2,4,6-trideoxy-beta-L-altropyranose hydrolase [Lachnospiraceae bacterium]|jgi:UDP-2,4-diacetamido-2,4,6-trideoxy-beta-L-altropyranose hydrolase|nr:UDP-2,4-diacetamido-2,4,6-trideoxy-beta-L-altropyranose hydrolase [Lachnospiraceae bacterium]
MIIFRTDANSDIATGHMVRSIAIANECHAHGEAVCFVVADEISAEIMAGFCRETISHHVEILDSSYNDMEAELPKFIDFLLKKKPKALLLDSYFATSRYITSLNDYTRTFYLDDFGNYDMPAAVIIDYTAKANHLQTTRKTHENRRTAKYLLGSMYTPLREQFRDVKYHVREEVRDIFISAGGSDIGNMTGELLELIQEMTADGIRFHVVVGIVNPHRDRLRAQFAAVANIIFYENVSEMASLMQECDIAITAAGSTICELCAVGVPTICFTVADNQVTNAEGLSAAGAVIYVGSQQDDKEGEDSKSVAGDIKAHLFALIGDFPRRTSMSAQMRSIVDGQGASRIAKELMG